MGCCINSLKLTLHCMCLPSSRQSASHYHPFLRKPRGKALAPNQWGATYKATANNPRNNTVALMSQRQVISLKLESSSSESLHNSLDAVNVTIPKYLINFLINQIKHYLMGGIQRVPSSTLVPCFFSFRHSSSRK